VRYMKRENPKICIFCGLHGDRKNMNMEVIAGNEIYWHSQNCPIRVRMKLREIERKLSSGDEQKRIEGWREFEKYISRVNKYD